MTHTRITRLNGAVIGSGETLREAVEANISNLRGADLHEADLHEADLRMADLRWASLRMANLSGADLSGADLRWASLRMANLSGADLSGADLRMANLRMADLRGGKIDDKTRFPAYQLPEGQLTVYKTIDGVLVTLQIAHDVKRTACLTSRKCRAERALVVAIEGKVEVTSNGRGYGVTTTYRVGEIVEADSYNDNPLVECSHGIHFFPTKDEALESGF